MYAIPLLGVICYTTYNHYLHGFEEQAGHWVMEPFFNDHTAYGAILSLFIPIFMGFSFTKTHSKLTRFLQALPVTAAVLPARPAFGSEVELVKDTPSARPQAVADTWGQFTGLGVTAWDGQTKLFYYDPAKTPDTLTEELSGLLGQPTHNGTCIAWAKFLAASFQVNGVNASDVELYKKIGVWQPTAAEFYVKKCNFFVSPFTGKLTPSPQPGVEGQNSSPTPSQKSFSTHRIVKVPSSCALNGSAIYLDPSYGITAPDLLNYTHQALDGWTDENGLWQRASDHPDEQMTEN